LRGPAAAAVCQELTVNDVRRLRIGDGQYTVFCNERGGVLDDLIVFHLGPERYLLVVNAANTAADYAWVRAHAGERAEVVDRSAELALLALQGPEAELALRDTLRLEAGLPLCGTDMDETTTPLEASLAWTVKLDKGDFVGRAVLAEQAARGATRRLVGLELAEPGIPRHGYPVWRDGAA